MTDIASNMPRSDSLYFRLGRAMSVSLTSVPVYAWLLFVVLMPNVLLIGTSFLRSSSGTILFEPNLANYARLWSSTGFWVLLFRTLAYSFGGWFIATLIAYPLA